MSRLSMHTANQPQFAGLVANRGVRTLRRNDTGPFITPSKGLYHHQWLWDAGFHAIVLSHFGEFERAKKEMRSLLSAQGPEGMVPHIQFNPQVSATQYRPNADDWATGRNASGITQPPLVATALKTVYDKTGDKDFARQLFPKVLKYHQWLHTDRNPMRNGLMAIVHPWEAGTDNSPIFDGLRDRLVSERFADVKIPKRVDTKNINAEQRPKDDDYKVYWGLIEIFQKAGWNQRQMVADSPFLVAEPLTNTLWAKANEDLAALAEELGYTKEAETLSAWAEETREAMRDTMWNEQDGIFHAYDMRAGEQIKVKTVNGLVPLYANVPTQAMADAMVLRNITDPGKFWSNAGVRSTAKDESGYDENRYWRGPVWINTQWLLVNGLQRYNNAQFNTVADRIIDKSRKLVRQSGYREYYHPDTMQGLGAPAFSWSTLVHTMNKTNPSVFERLTKPVRRVLGG